MVDAAARRFLIAAMAIPARIIRRVTHHLCQFGQHWARQVEPLGGKRIRMQHHTRITVAPFVLGASLLAASASAAPADGTQGAASDGDSARVAAHDPEAATAIGLRYRGLLLPKPALNWFVEGGKSVYVHGVGPELSIPDGSGEYLLSAWLAFYSMSPVALKGSGDVEEAWEIVESQMKSLYLTIDYLWTTPLGEHLALSYGGGAGLGFLFGDLKRTQAALETNGRAGNPDDYAACSGEGQPNLNYCDQSNSHYAGYGEPNWFHGGSKPVVFPWLSGQVGLRYRVQDKLVTRLDLGVATSGLFLGLGADYSL
jgi:hypothetical protein